MELDLAHLASKEGLLQLITMVSDLFWVAQFFFLKKIAFKGSNLLGAIMVFCCVYHPNNSDMNFFLFTSLSALITGIIQLIVRLTHTHNKIKHWQLIRLGFDTLWAFFYLIASNIIIKYVRYWCQILGAAVFFGYVSLVCFILDLILCAMWLKSKTENGQGSADNPDSGRPWTTQEPLPKYWTLRHMCVYCF